MAFSANVNFQGGGNAIPAGYQPDYGNVYADRGNGLTYGWTATNFNGVDRNSSLSPDQRYDTLNFLQPANGPKVWEIAVPNGSYSVKIVSGDAGAFGHTHKVNAEGVLTVSGTTTSSARWLTGTKTVNVSDGRLTVAAAAGASAARINFIEVRQLTPSPPPPPAGTTVSVRPAADAYGLNGPTANTNYGNSGELQVRLSSVSGHWRESFLRFDLSRVAADDQITSAALRLTGRLSQAGSVTLGLFPVTAGAGWTEGGLTWNNKPVSGNTAIGPLKTLTNTANATIDFDVTSYLKQQKGLGAPAVDFVVKATNYTTPFVVFASDEAAAGRPELRVNQTAPPAPSIVLSQTSATVAEGGTTSATTVRLSAQPTGDVTVYVAHSSGDGDLSAAPAAFVFTPADWATPRPLTLSAAQDADATNGSAEFAFVASGYPTVRLIATERDDDVVAPTGPRLDLLNSVNDSVIAPFTNGYVIDMGQTGTRLNVRATPAGTPGSLVFKLDGRVVSTETYAPYSVGGDSNGGFNDWTPPTGTHTLQVLQYTGTGGTGTVQGTTTVTFTAIARNALAVGGLVLVNTATGQPIGPLVDGATIDIGQLGGALSARASLASTSPAAGSVAFLLDGQRYQLDNTAPFHAAGEDGSTIRALPLSPGFHTLTVLPYAAANAGGTAGQGLTVSFVVTPLAPSQAPVAALDAGRVRRLFDFAAQQLKLGAADFAGTGKFPRITQADGKWTQTGTGEWSSGFFPGSLWQMYKQTGDRTWLDLATPMANGLRVNASGTEDTAFKFFLPLLPVYATTGDPALRALLLQAAAAKSSQYDPDVKAFQTTWRKSSSGNPRANFGVLMDQMMDLELLFWAAKQTGNQTYYDQAVNNARTVANHLIRADGGSFHWGYFDKDTGDFVSGETAQGYADDSTWARGQAWGVYAFAMVYRETGMPEFLAASKKMSDFFMANLPADQVPFWDFDDPKIPNTFKDTSASAIAAAGMLLLADVAPAPADQSAYAAHGGQLLAALASPGYLAEGTNSRAILNRGAWYVPFPVLSGESGTVWGDNYFLEALNRYAGRIS